jgi:uncharacterized protein (TIGR02391 family)
LTAASEESAYTGTGFRLYLGFYPAEKGCECSSLWIPRSEQLDCQVSLEQRCKILANLVSRSTIVAKMPLGREQGRKRLARMKLNGEKLLENRPISRSDLETWTDTVADLIRSIFGSESDHIASFYGPMMMIGIGSTEADYKRNRFDTLKQRLSCLDSLLLTLDLLLASGQDEPNEVGKNGYDIWQMLHPTLTRIAKSRFDAGHYADAVESALKELNAAIKELVLRKTGKELDGISLMHEAFSPKNPIITLDDLSTQTGRNMQQGYMEIFAGAMAGIRNPNAHGNVVIDDERAIHHLFLASLLFHKLDERP